MRWNEPAPGEHEAGDRSWEVVSAAFEERLPAQRRRDWRPFVLPAAMARRIAWPSISRIWRCQLCWATCNRAGWRSRISPHFQT